MGVAGGPDLLADGLLQLLLQADALCPGIGGQFNSFRLALSLALALALALALIRNLRFGLWNAGCKGWEGGGYLPKIPPSKLH